MEKKLKLFKTTTVILIVILLSAVAFGGLYVKQKGVWTNILPDFSYGMELDGVRELRFVLNSKEEEKQIYVDKDGNYAGDVLETSTGSNTAIDLVDENGNPISNNENSQEENKEEQKDEMLNDYTIETRTIKTNPAEDINITNLEKTKKIIQARLDTIDLYEYNIRLDNITGELVIEVPDNDNVGVEQSFVTTGGKFEILDSQNGIILLDNSNISKAQSSYHTSENGYQAYLNVQLDKEGTEKLKEISKKYVEITAEDGTTSNKYVTVEFDDQQLLQTYFGDEITSGMLQIPFGQPTKEQKDFLVVYNNTTRIANILNEEQLPLKYELSADNFIKSSVELEDRAIAVASFAVIILILSITMVVKYKKKGLKLAVYNVGYIAILTLIFRYANVLLTFNSLTAFVGVVGINLLFECKLLGYLKLNDDPRLAFPQAMKELYLAVIPVCIISVIFTFMAGAVISSIGMVLFWGLIIQAFYNWLLYVVSAI